MKELEQNAFLLHSRPLRDNQVIAEFLTELNGKVSAIVYVGTSLKSNKKALLQPFTPLIIVLKGNGNLKTLNRIEVSSKSFLLTSEHLYSGFYLNELQVRLLGEHIPYENLYALYKRCLVQLAEKNAIEPVLRRFENTLLEELGLTIDFSVINDQVEQFYYFPEQGFIPVIENLTQPRYSRAHLIAINNQDFSDVEVRKTHKVLMRQIINHLLGGKPLNSRQLFKKR
ncbi:DNA repair protein RecO [Colwellia sp. 1_MG-2023]|uniref:DNA repair protein RecO n=1 Tax=Colwellia sp. 1_MG-2023 TaxID=3062649 RepID=UPI0026E24014|nr:DNA repair protein RecO [Colwellia sp. 1_MG-2023]MDO6446594.1 DNA repair protein RecO [Colwellia sp. 1_MG-2023]